MINKFVITFIIVSVFFAAYYLWPKQETPKPASKQGSDSNSIQFSVCNVWVDAEIVKSF